MGTDSQILELVGLVYDAAANPDTWPRFLERLAETIDGDGTVLFALEPEMPLRSIAALTRFDPVLIDRYVREFPENIWVQRADSRFKDHEVRYSQGLTTTAELQRDRYYADFLGPARVAHSYSLKIDYGASLPAYLASTRSPRKPGFEETEGKVLLTLEPHIRRALELHRRVGGNLAFNRMLDALPTGIVFADQNGRLLWWNRRAEEIFEAKDGLWAGPTGFRTARRNEEEKLRALIRQASMVETKAMPSAGAMAISRPSLCRSYAVLVSPLRQAQSPVSKAVVAVLITDPERGVPDGAAARLAQQFGLTPAEANVAAALLDGASVETVADSLSVGIATARTHVRKILEKTGTKRQSELVRVLLSGPYLHDSRS
jgi:DNA-binding CsgD family transcriptional regulator/PAS domain-containing protein